MMKNSIVSYTSLQLVLLFAGSTLSSYLLITNITGVRKDHDTSNTEIARKEGFSYGSLNNNNFPAVINPYTNELQRRAWLKGYAEGYLNAKKEKE